MCTELDWHRRPSTANRTRPAPSLLCCSQIYRKAGLTSSPFFFFFYISAFKVRRAHQHVFFKAQRFPFTYAAQWKTLRVALGWWEGLMSCKGRRFKTESLEISTQLMVVARTNQEWRSSRVCSLARLLTRGRLGEIRRGEFRSV